VVALAAGFNNFILWFETNGRAMVLMPVQMLFLLCLTTEQLSIPGNAVESASEESADGNTLSLFSDQVQLLEQWCPVISAHPNQMFEMIDLWLQCLCA